MPDVQPSVIAGVFHRPFDEQVAFFRAKLGKLVPTRFWDDLKKAEHDRAFMVAGATKAELLQDLAQAVDRAIAEGQSIDAFRKDFFSIAQQHGWTDYTGSGTTGGRAWRTRVIYTTNAQVSYAAGRLAQLRAAGFSLWVYRHNDSVLHPRPWHLAWNGLTLAPDDPFWKAHYPPSGWGCRCYVVGARNSEDAKLLGGDPDKEIPPGTDAVDPKTGEPMGIDEGWGYTPGDTVSDAVNALVEKPVNWDYDIAKAFMEDLPKDTQDAFATSYRNLPSVADDARRYVQRVTNVGTTAQVEVAHTLGIATSAQVDAVSRAIGVDVSGFDFSLDADGVRGALAGTGMPAAAETPDAASFALMPQVLNATGAAVTAVDSGGAPTVQLVARIEGQSLVTRWVVDAARRTLSLVGFWRR